MNIHEVGADWTSLISIFTVIRLVLLGTAITLMVDLAAFVGYLDGPKASKCFKLMTGFMAGSYSGLAIAALMGNIDYMLLFGTGSLLSQAYVRLWTWVKGFHMSEFIAGKTIKMRRK